jgi:uncharacterized protein
VVDALITRFDKEGANVAGEDRAALAAVSFDRPPSAACWQHQGLRSGFEVVYFTTGSSGLQIEGTTTGLQDDDIWVMGYRVELDSLWNTRRAWISGRTGRGSVDRLIESDGDGHWRVDGLAAPDLDGCLDVDLESSALTNALPVHRLGLGVGEEAVAPAAYVRLSGGVDRLEQSYARIDDDHGRRLYDYEAPVFDFRCRLTYDRSGLILEYPGIATRAA